MAERRMFTQKIVGSDPFTEMPLSAQALYFHLNMEADDDGFVNNPQKIRRSVGAAEDDLKLLIAKRFLLAFENGVVVIKHWRMHNLLRKDRYKETQYIEQKNTLSLKDNGAYTEADFDTSQPNDNHLATTWQPTDNQVTPQDSIGKESIGKESIVHTQQIADLFNSLCPSLPSIKKISDKREKAIKDLLCVCDLKTIEQIFKKVEESDFLTGKTSNGWKASFDWLVVADNAIKVLEGNFDNKKKKSRYDFAALERQTFEQLHAVQIKGNPELEKEAAELKKVLQENY